jgi:hypothetical protein
MEIGLLYSSDNSGHRRVADFVKQAVENLGISARIIETDLKTPRPKIVVNGFDLLNQINNLKNGKTISVPYETVEKLLEKTAW